eukprot:230120-Pyramimonas_sp.AAC.3
MAELYQPQRAYIVLSKCFCQEHKRVVSLTRPMVSTRIGYVATTATAGPRACASGAERRAGASTSSLCASDVLDMLQQEDDIKDGIQQSADITDEDLAMVMDRDDLLGKKAPYPVVGPGWEVVTEATGSALLGSVA